MIIFPSCACGLLEIYYDASVDNRAKYDSAEKLEKALGKKYLFGSDYSQYSYGECICFPIDC